jgi:outer membrane protein assembly factor BamB
MKQRLQLSLYLLISFMFSAVHAGIFDTNTDVNINAYADAEQRIKEAGKYKPVKWKLPLAQNVIENMLMLDENLAALSLRNYNENLKRDRVTLVNLEKGKTLWTHPADEEASDLSIVAVSKDYILIRTDYDNTTSLTALKIRSGQQAWQKKLPATGMLMIQQLDQNHIMLITANNDDVEYQYVKIISGEKQWSYHAEKGGSPFTQVITYKKNNIIILGEQLVGLNAKNGLLRWKFKSIKYNANTAAPLLKYDSLYIVDSNNVLNKINLSRGKLIWQHKNPKQYLLTAIDANKTQVYLRGIEKAGTGQESILIKIDNKRGRLKWRTSIKDKLSLVSNLLEYKDIIYVASPTTLYALRKKTGEIKYSKVVSRSQLSLYPVILRRVDKNIAFIGELSIGAYQANTGRRIYRRSMDGIHQAADLSVVDVSIKRLRKKLLQKGSALKETWRCVSCEMSATAQARADQLYNKSWQGGLTDYESIEGGMARKMSGVYAAVGAYESAVHFSEVLYDAVVSQRDKENLARHQLIRTTIINSYPAMMTENYAYRPTRFTNQISSEAGVFMQITAINLHSGKRNKTSMSVPYKDYGLWIYVDEKKKIAYQQSIGLYPDENSPVMSYLIAKPIELSQ